MSIGFHYFETINTSLTLQWLSKEEAPSFLGKVIGYSSLAGLIAYGAVWLATAVLKLDYVVIYSTTGVIGIAMVIHLWKIFPNIEGLIPQRKNLFLKKKYLK